ncbi:MAG: hypothetical protein AABZ30_08470 [Myxococcota bacterium]
MAHYCWKCRNELVFEVQYGVKVGRQETCPHCHSDMHCCKNCELYDPALHNQCKDSQAPFIRDREAGNFCSLFSIKNLAGPPTADDSAAKAKSKLEALFRR